MNITISWDDVLPNVVCYSFQSVWGWDDFFEAVTEAKRLIDTAPGDVGVIMAGDTKFMRLPSNSLMHFREALRATHPKTRIVVIVSDNAYLGMMVDTLTRITGMRGGKLKVVSTLDEARALIQKRLGEDSK